MKKKGIKQDRFYRDPKLLKKLAKLEHLKNLDMLEVKRTTQITPFYKESPDSVDSKKSDVNLILKSIDEGLAYVGDKPRFWLLDYLDIGLKLVKYVKKKDENILFETIKKYPFIIFDDGRETALSIWLATTEKERLSIIETLEKTLKEPQYPDSAENRWNRYWIEVMRLNDYYNPIKRKLEDLSIITAVGTKAEKEKAKKCLKELGMNFLIQTPVGRSRKFIDSEELHSRHFDNPYFKYIDRLRTQETIVNESYEKVYSKVKQIFKDNKFQAYRRRSLREYIIEEGLVESLKKPLSIPSSDSYETSVNKIVDKLSSERPRDIALTIVGAKFSVSPRKIKKIVRTSMRPEIREIIEAIKSEDSS